MATSTFFTQRVSCCRPEAYQFFCQQLPLLNTREGLLRAAIAISMHALDDVDPQLVEERLQVLSLRVRERAPSGREAASLANLHAVLFDEEGFRGNLERYYNALNSYVPAVLNTREGIPVTLSLIYMFVGEGAGLAVQGVNAPGHFMVRVRCDQRWMIVDPFFAGQVLTRNEAFDRIDRVLGKSMARRDELLSTPTHEQWLVRILANLQHLFTAEERRDDLAAVTELAAALTQSKSTHAVRPAS